MSEQDIFSIDTEAGLYAARAGNLRAFLWRTAAHQLEDGTDAPQAFRFCLPNRELSESDHLLDSEFAEREQVYLAGEVSQRDVARYMSKRVASIREMERVLNQEIAGEVALESKPAY